MVKFNLNRRIAFFSVSIFLIANLLPSAEVEDMGRELSKQNIEIINLKEKIKRDRESLKFDSILSDYQKIYQISNSDDNKAKALFEIAEEQWFSGEYEESIGSFVNFLSLSQKTEQMVLQVITLYDIFPQIADLLESEKIDSNHVLAIIDQSFVTVDANPFPVILAKIQVLNAFSEYEESSYLLSKSSSLSENSWMDFLYVLSSISLSLKSNSLDIVLPMISEIAEDNKYALYHKHLCRFIGIESLHLHNDFQRTEEALLLHEFNRSLFDDYRKVAGSVGYRISEFQYGMMQIQNKDTRESGFERLSKLAEEDSQSEEVLHAKLKTLIHENLNASISDLGSIVDGFKENCNSIYLCNMADAYVYSLAKKLGDRNEMSKREFKADMIKKLSSRLGDDRNRGTIELYKLMLN